FSRRQFSILHSRFRLKHRNSAAFRSLCERQKKAGFNFFQIWMDSHGFNPVFREQQAAGEAL
ncbi:MAG: hypothetical protein OEW04_03575, partial [Nitrospirota bacterium]|nr:hypothetical protein [Nitrospirota bacterium]